jgi:hypothetical protein
VQGRAVAVVELEREPELGPEREPEPDADPEFKRETVKLDVLPLLPQSAEEASESGVVSSSSEDELASDLGVLRLGGGIAALVLATGGPSMMAFALTARPFALARSVEGRRALSPRPKLSMSFIWYSKAASGMSCVGGCLRLIP